MPRRLKKRQYKGTANGKWLLPDWQWLFTGIAINRHEAPNPFLYFAHHEMIKRLTPLWQAEKDRIMRFWEDKKSEPDFPFADELCFNGIGDLFDRPYLFWYLVPGYYPIMKADRMEILRDLGELTNSEKEFLKTNKIGEDEY